MPELQPPPGDRYPRSFASEILILVFAASFATAALVSWSAGQATRAQLWRDIDQHYPAAARDCAESLAAWLRDARGELATLAAHAPRRGALAALPSRPAAFRRLEWLGPDGSVLDAAGAGEPLAAAERAELVAGAAQGLHRLAPRVVASAPLAGGRGALVGVLREDALLRLLLEDPPDRDARLLLVDPEGRVAIAPPHARVRDDEPVALLSLPGPRLGVVRDYRDARGVRMLGAAHPVAASGWHVVVETPRARAFAPVHALLWRVLALAAAVVLAFSLLAYRIARAIARPLVHLADGARRIAQGRFDLEVPEPARRDEIGLLARSLNEMMRKLREYQQEVESAHRTLTGRNLELQQAKEAFEQLSITDGLTRLHNHRFFHEALTREIKRVSRTGEALSMLMLDIDDFKRLNDRFGHAAGDELLSGIAHILSDSVRDSDLLARYGGEEFVVLASDTEIEGALRLAEKIRTQIAESSFILDDSLRPVRVTVSIGVAQYAGNRKLFFQAADRALYRAKAEGKNCVIVDDELRVI